MRMTLAVAGAAGGVFNSPLASSVSSNWLADTFSAIKNSQNSGGMLGALENAGSSNGSVSSFLGQASDFSNSLQLISQNSVTNAGSFYSQIAQQNQQAAANKKLQQALDDLQSTTVQPQNVLPSTIFFQNGSSLDTASNILTMPDGTQYDTVTGARYFDPSYMIQMANGAYLDTKDNILTLADGTQIDTVTGLKLSVEA
jgi:hypothetical protein